MQFRPSKKFYLENNTTHVLKLRPLDILNCLCAIKKGRKNMNIVQSRPKLHKYWPLTPGTPEISYLHLFEKKSKREAQKL